MFGPDGMVEFEYEKTYSWYESESSSIFFREALESFSKQLHKTIPDIDKTLNFTKEQTTKASLLLEHQFGVGGKSDMHWLKRFKPTSTTATINL